MRHAPLVAAAVVGVFAAGAISGCGSSEEAGPTTYVRPGHTASEFDFSPTSSTSVTPAPAFDSMPPSGTEFGFIGSPAHCDGDDRAVIVTASSSDDPHRFVVCRDADGERYLRAYTEKRDGDTGSMPVPKEAVRGTFASEDAKGTVFTVAPQTSIRIGPQSVSIEWPPTAKSFRTTTLVMAQRWTSP
ncbi:hypothetical protein FK529_18475 [Tsukamurella asaccharolytica]|uniref:Uncharacterized protein n=1 Tax=Tsukamurella asaccharolytica TaxID=2592067 RepID=A0A5C5R6R4_9ACTN|nr:hypothetical protein [Tsukamurella asaccharolytica]TWS17855.1 hypothetical protein FK529_18475 [Tsukamurella asaccharolytica]